MAAISVQKISKYRFGTLNSSSLNLYFPQLFIIHYWYKNSLCNPISPHFTLSGKLTSSRGVYKDSIYPATFQ